MYHQSKELADVDIAAEAMEVGPTCHYVMGGIEVDPDTAAASVPGLFAAGEVAGGMHGSNRLGGNSLSDLLVFGRRAGAAAAAHAATRRGSPQPLSDDDLSDAARAALSPFEREGGENPYAVQHDLQQTMHDLVGIIRTAAEMEEALQRIETLKKRVANLSVEGHRQYNPGWHLALDLPHMLLVSECIARAALEREENPSAVQPTRQQRRQDLVAITRPAAEMEGARQRIGTLKKRVPTRSAGGHRQYNPGWHLALDLPHMLLVSECIARAALEREESRGGHTRDDFPATDAEWARTNLVCSRDPEGGVVLTRQPLPTMPAELAEIFEEAP